MPTSPNAGSEQDNIWTDLGGYASSDKTGGRNRAISGESPRSEARLPDGQARSTGYLQGHRECPPVADARAEDVVQEEQEDKNRKVLRCLDTGDTVQAVFNASRIVGLSAKGECLRTPSSLVVTS